MFVGLLKSSLLKLVSVFMREENYCKSVMDRNTDHVWFLRYDRYIFNAFINKKAASMRNDFRVHRRSIDSTATPVYN